MIYLFISRHMKQI